MLANSCLLLILPCLEYSLSLNVETLHLQFFVIKRKLNNLAHKETDCLHEKKKKIWDCFPQCTAITMTL